nr:hydroxymethylglutaryl-CoA lyase [Fredinandcohnia onubensis]
MIEIVEVGPRDGLQNEKKLLTTNQKVQLIEKLINSGIKTVEAVSFVNPKVVPQMADAEEVMKQVPRIDGVNYAGLVLSRSGLERALNTNVDALHVVTATSDEFNLKNAKRTVSQSVEELIKVISEGVSAKKTVVGVLGTAFGCPFAGEVPVANLLKVAEAFVSAGAKGITLADTTGLANPSQVLDVVKTFKEEFKNDIELRLHFHNTRGLGLANVFAGFQAGVRRFDSSIAGLGGCPFAPKAVGNVCTEDMVNMFNKMGIETSTNLEELIQTALWMEQQMERPLDGMLMKTGIA